MPPPDPSTNLVFAAAVAQSPIVSSAKAPAADFESTRQAKLTPDKLRLMTGRDVAQCAAARAGITSAACIAAIQACGIKAKSYKKDWAEDELRGRLAPVEYFADNADHLDRVIAALVQMKLEAESISV